MHQQLSEHLLVTYTDLALQQLLGSVCRTLNPFNYWSFFHLFELNFVQSLLCLLPLLCICFILFRATTKHFIKEDPANKDVVIIVPGLFGSKLIYQDQQSAFPTMTQVLFDNLSDSVSETTRLPLATDGMQQSDGILAAPLTYDGFFNLDYLYLRYSEFYSKMRESCVLEVFNYDWRRDPLETASSLQKFIEYVVVKHPHSNIKVLCHSLGCRIGFKAIMDLNTQARLRIKGVVYVTGFFGTSNCGDMMDMLKNGFSFTPMCTFSAETLRSWPLFYHLILGKQDYTMTRNGKSEQLDLTDVHTWEKVLATKFDDSEKDHMKWVIAQSMKFNEWYENVDTNEHPTCLAVIGKKVQKHFVDFEVDQSENITFKQGKAEPSDGTIWEIDALPKCACEVRELADGISHAFAVSLANMSQVTTCLREVDEFAKYGG